MNEQPGFTQSFGGEEKQNEFQAVYDEVDLLNQIRLKGSRNINSGNNTGLASFINHHADFSAVHNETQPHAQFKAVEDSLGQNSAILMNVTNNVANSESSSYQRGLCLDNNANVFVDVQNIGHFTFDYQYEWKVQQKLTFFEVKDVGLDSILIKPETISNNSLGNGSSQMNMEENPSQEWQSVNEPFQQSVIKQQFSLEMDKKSMNLKRKNRSGIEDTRIFNNESFEADSFYENLDQINLMQKTINEDEFEQKKQQSSFSINLHQLQGKNNLYDKLLKGQNRQGEGINESQKILITKQTIEISNKTDNIIFNSFTESIDQIMIEQVPKQIQQMGNSAVKIWKQILKCFKLTYDIERYLLKTLSLSSIAKNSKQPILITANDIPLNQMERVINQIPQIIVKVFYLVQSAEVKKILHELQSIPVKQGIKLLPSILRILLSVFCIKIMNKIKLKFSVPEDILNQSHAHQLTHSLSSFLTQPLFNFFQTSGFENIEKTLNQQKKSSQILRFSSMTHKLVSNLKKLFIFDENQEIFELFNLTQVFESENRVKQLQQAFIKKPLDFS